MWFSLWSGMLWVLLVGCQLDGPKTQSVRLKKAAQYNIQLGSSYINQGDLERAKQKLITALNQDPHNPEAHLAMAFYWEQVRDIKQAEASYQQALYHGSKQGQVCHNYGTFLCRQKRYREADRLFQQAMRDHHYLKLAQTYVNAGFCAFQSQKLSKSRAYYQQALNIDGQLSQAWLGLVEWALAVQQPRQALDYFRQYERYVRTTAASMALGHRVMRANGRWSEARQYAERLRRQFPDSTAYQRLKDKT